MTQSDRDKNAQTPPAPSQNRSLGRKSISSSAQPRELMASGRLAKAWHAQVITLFPDGFPGFLGQSLTGKALKEGIWQLDTVDLRRFGEGKHRKVDDTPSGGGAGLVLRADIMGAAIDHSAVSAPQNAPLIYLSPRGARFDQTLAQTWADGPGVRLICGRFEGLDERVIEHYNIIEVSLGDFVMTGGEMAAQAMLDAAVRLLPGVLGNSASAIDESHTNGLLEHPQYTRPAQWNALDIPDVLLSGDHGKIASWRRGMAERLTQQRRPDLWRAYCLKHGRDPEEDQEL